MLSDRHWPGWTGFSRVQEVWGGRVYFVYDNKFITRQSYSAVEGSEMDCKIVDLSVSDVR